MRHDRLSVLEQWGLVEGEAMGVELAHGLVSLESDALVGAAQFVGGWGRLGAPVNGAPSPAPARHKAPHRSDEKP
jgi:enoyl-CoA hydratase